MERAVTAERETAEELAVTLREAITRLNRRVRQTRPVGDLTFSQLSALTSLKLTPAVTGTATLTDGALHFPITGGNVKYFDPKQKYRPYVQGEIDHAGGQVVDVDLQPEPGRVDEQGAEDGRDDVRLGPGHDGDFHELGLLPDDRGTVRPGSGARYLRTEVRRRVEVQAHA